MVDILYSAITRPLANEPESRNHFAVAAPYKDGQTRKVGKDDPKKNQQQAQNKTIDEELNEAESDDDLVVKGKGIYRDDAGRRHLDFYV